MVEDQDLRSTLIRFREDVINLEYADDTASRKHCVLRRGMIDHLVQFKPATHEEWIDSLPNHLLRNTDLNQMRRYSEAIIELVCRHLRQLGRLPPPLWPYMCVDNEDPVEQARRLAELRAEWAAEKAKKRK